MDIIQTIFSFVSSIEDLLETYASNPLFYSIAFFVYVILVTIIIPLPVELGLLLSPGTPVIVLAIILGLGRVIGSILVFYAGHNIGVATHMLFHRWKWTRWLTNRLDNLISKLNYLGLYIIMSGPFMPDTLTLYSFSISDVRKDFKVQWFALTNFLAGFTRAVVFLILLDLLGGSLLKYI